MTRDHLPRGARAVLGMAVPALLLGGCQAAVQPRTSVDCPPGKVAVQVTNVSTRAARYTVDVEFVRAGEKETEQYSSNRVEPGASATLNDERPAESQTCRVTAVQVWPA